MYTYSYTLSGTVLEAIYLLSFFLIFPFFLQTCKAVYDRILDLRISTPQIIINYGMFLEENNYFEDAFKVIIFS